MHLTNYSIQKSSNEFIRDEQSGTKRLIFPIILTSFHKFSMLVEKHLWTKNTNRKKESYHYLSLILFVCF